MSARRRAAVSAIGVLLVASLSACGGSDGDGSGAADDPIAKVQALPATTTLDVACRAQPGSTAAKPKPWPWTVTASAVTTVGAIRPYVAKHDGYVAGLDGLDDADQVTLCVSSGPGINALVETPPKSAVIAVPANGTFFPAAIVP